MVRFYPSHSCSSIGCVFGVHYLALFISRWRRRDKPIDKSKAASLTTRSRGAPTACHQAWSAGARTFSTAQAWRHAVGAPLSSNVRRLECGARLPGCASCFVGTRFQLSYQLQNQSPVQVRKTGMQTQGDGAFGQQSLALQASAQGVVRRRAQPNPALKGRSNGAPPGPEPRYAVHFLFSGPGVTPSASPLARTLGGTMVLRQGRIGSPGFAGIRSEQAWAKPDRSSGVLGGKTKPPKCPSLFGSPFGAQGVCPSNNRYLRPRAA
jgi:hypothetical protein